MLEIGSLVDGKYRILNKVGQGGMSVVYMAMNERANKTWAIKEVRKDGTQDFDVVKQGLIVETDMLKRLNHSHLPSIIDVIEGDESFLIVMDFIEGKTLKDILKEYGPQPQESVVDWAKQLCDVLGYLHSREPAIIYRDMKPSNVMLKPDGNIVLFDFGTAREYKIHSQEDTTCLGTKGYAAPEQYGGHGQTDARTDIYCLGATMYHLLTAHNPGEPPYEMYPIRQWNPALSAGLEAIILKCTQNNPADRYQSCAELLYALDHYWEWDASYRKKQTSQLRKFLLPAVLTIGFGVGAMTFRSLENHTKTSNYDAYIESAETATDKEKRVEFCRKAIEIDPTNESAYMTLLEDVYLKDGRFTYEESVELNDILDKSSRSDGTTNKMLFSSGNSDGYAQFAYALGVDYYYRYYKDDESTDADSDAGKNSARAYFKVASESGSLSQKEVTRAKCLARVCEYYSKLGVPDVTGDSTSSFKDYWDDLVELLEGNLVEEDNPVTALLMYNELVAQLEFRALDFKNDNVKLEDILTELDVIQKHLGTDFQEAGDSIQVQTKSLSERIDALKDSVTRLYDNEQGGTE